MNVKSSTHLHNTSFEFNSVCARTSKPHIHLQSFHDFAYTTSRVLRAHSMPTICRLTDECRLTSLPPELRSLIYRYAVVADQPLIAFFDCQAKQKPADSADTKRVSYHYKLLPARPELASTSRQLRDEVLPIFYGGNTFIFSLDSMFCNVIGRWVKLAQRAPATSHIRNVVLEFDVKRRALVVRRPRES